MQITFRNTLDDMIALSRYHMNESPTMKRALVVQKIVMALITIIGSILLLWVISTMTDRSIRQSTYESSSIVIILGGVFVYYSTGWILERRILTMTRKLYQEGKNSKLHQDHILTITPEHITIVAPYGESVFQWSGIERCIDTHAYIFLYIDAIQAIVLPINAFSSPEQRTLFIERVREYHTASL